MIVPLFTARNTPARCIILMSGSGSNAEALLKYAEENPGSYDPVAIFTDCPENSRGSEIARNFGKPLLASDIRAFYAANGENSIKLDTPRRRELRDMWSDEASRIMAPFNADFLLFAGFVPLTNLTGRMPCLNVHPGDLTVTDAQGQRIFAGLHYLPVERAILSGYPALRSSVILAMPYSGDGSSEMDSGHILGLSAPVPVELEGETLESLRTIQSSRTAPPFRDRLRELAKTNVELLKTHGDHQVFPRAAADFAAGRFGSDPSDGSFYFRSTEDAAWQQITTVCYGSDGGRVLIKD